MNEGGLGVIRSFPEVSLCAEDDEEGFVIREEADEGLEEGRTKGVSSESSSSAKLSRLFFLGLVAEAEAVVVGLAAVPLVVLAEVSSSSPSSPPRRRKLRDLPDMIWRRRRVFHGGAKNVE